MHSAYSFVNFIIYLFIYSSFIAANSSTGASVFVYLTVKLILSWWILFCWVILLCHEVSE